MNGRDVDDLPLAQPLTPREQDILECIGDELTNSQMAERLTLSVGTVKWYVRQVYNKLGVSNREGAISRAQSLGLLPAEAPQPALRNNLLVAVTLFVSREMELATLAVLIADPQVRIITITGPGCIGKTRLALEAARGEVHTQSLFPDGVFFVSLAPLETAVEIISALAAALDFQFQGRGRSNETQKLLDYLKYKQMLLVMDNFEHILEGKTLLAEISSQAAGIMLLVTSRERLQLRGEQLFPLQGLALAQTGESAAKAPAARLFLHTARRAVADFQLLEGDVAHLLHICQLVGACRWGWNWPPPGSTCFLYPK